MFAISDGAMSLIIFGFCIVLFVSEKLPMATTAILGSALMVVFGVASFADVFGQFASSSVILVISVMVVGQAMFDTGLARLIGSGILRLTGNSEKRILLIATTVCSLISAFMSNVATLAMFISVLYNLNTQRQRVDLRNLLLPVAMGSVVGGVCTLIGSAPQMVAQGLLEEAVGKGLGFFDYAIVGIFLVIALVIYVYFIGYPLGKRIWGNRALSEEELAEIGAMEQSASLEQSRYDGETPAQRKRRRTKMWIMAVIFVLMGIFFFLEPVPIAIVGALAALACIVTGCINQKEALKRISWSSVGKLAGCLGIMQAVNKSGGGKLIAQAVFAVIGYEIPPELLFILMCALTMLLSEFLTNSTAVLIVLPMAISVAPEMGLNIHSFAMGITLASSVALATPLSCTPLTMITGYGYRFRDYVKYSLPLDLIQLILIIVLVPLFFPLVN